MHTVCRCTEPQQLSAHHQGDMSAVQPVEGIEHHAAVIFPIIAAGDVTGAVVMLQSDTIKAPSDAEIKLCQSAAAFLGKQMEE